MFDLNTKRVGKAKGSSPAAFLFQPKPYKVIDLYKMYQMYNDFFKGSSPKKIFFEYC